MKCTVRVFMPMKNEQNFSIVLIVVGVFGLQISLYELIVGNISLLMVGAMMVIGGVLAYSGVDKYRKIQDE